MSPSDAVPSPSAADPGPSSEALSPEDLRRLRDVPTQQLPPPADDPSGTSGARTELLPHAQLSDVARTSPVAAPDLIADARERIGSCFGRYRLLAELGHGGMGIVWKALDTSLQRTVALKQILARRGSSPDSVERFMQEARLAAKLHHPNIVAVHDVGVHEGQHYFTTDYVEGATLTKRLGQRAPVRDVVGWLRQVAEGLHHAHEQGVVHRDIKPENILIDGAGRALLTDFGLAKEVELADALERRALTVSGALVGTPEYMSPEQAAGHRERVGPASDQFALGAVLYLALAGRPPFRGSSLRDLLNAIAESEPERPGARRPEVDRDLETICLRMLEKEPERRYPSLAETAADLGRWLAGEPIRARRASWAERARAWTRKHRREVAGIAAAALLAGGLAGWGVSARVAEARRRTEARERAVAAERRVAETPDDARDAALAAARDAWVQALALAPDDAESRAGLGRIEAARAGREEARRGTADAEARARERIGRARSLLEPALRYLYDAEARYAELIRRVDAAQKEIEEAIALAPHLADGHYLLGWAWDLKGWDDRAEACWREAIARDPAHALAEFRLGRLLLTRAFLAMSTGIDEELADGRTRSAAFAQEARALFETAAQGPGSAALEAESATWRDASLALQAWVEGRHDDVRRLCYRALDRDEEEGKEDVQLLLGCLQTEHKLARQVLTRALERRPKFALALFCRGYRWEQDGRRNEALADYSAALAIHPRLVPAWVNRGRLRRIQGDRAGALSDATSALEVDPEFVWARFNRGWLHLERGDTEAAIADFERVVARLPDWPKGRAGRGLARYRAGLLGPAREDLDRALAAPGDLPEAWRGRGMVRLASGDLAGAADDLERATQEAARGGWTWADCRTLAQEARRVDAEVRRTEAPAWLAALAGATLVLRRGDLAAARSGFEATLPRADASDVPARWQTERVAAHYNLACVYSRLSAGPGTDPGERRAPAPEEAARLRDLAFRELEAAVALGWSDAGHSDRDPDLAPLRDDRRWAEFAARLRR